MSVTKTTGKITFSFTTNTLFLEVGKESLLAVSNLPAKEGFDFNDYWMNENKQEIFSLFLSDIHSILSSKLFKLSFGVTNAFVNDGTVISYSVKDKEAYNENILKAVDQLIYEALKNYVLKEWFIKNELADLAKFFNDKYMVNIHSFEKQTISLRKTEVV